MRRGLVLVAALVAPTACRSVEVEDGAGGAASASSSISVASTTTVASSSTGSNLPDCITRLSGSMERTPLDLTLKSDGPQWGQFEALDVGPRGEIAFAGVAFGNGSLTLGDAALGTCNGSSCLFVGVLHEDGSLAWSRMAGSNYVTIGAARFRGGLLEVVLSADGLVGAPFPPDAGVFGPMDIFVARFDTTGGLASFNRTGFTGSAIPLSLAYAPAQDGGAFVGGYFFNGVDGQPPGTFTGCGISAQIDNGRAYLARLDESGMCVHIDIVGGTTGNQTVRSIAADGGSPENVVVTLDGMGELTLGAETVGMPDDVSRAFWTSGVEAGSDVDWAALHLLGSSVEPFGATAVTTRDGAFLLGRVDASDPSGTPLGGGDLVLRDLAGAFALRLGSASDDRVWDVATGPSTTGLSADRPIAISGWSEDAPTDFGGGIGTGPGDWLALVDGAGNACAAVATPAGHLVVEGGTIVYAFQPDVSTIRLRRTPFSALVQ